MSATTLDISELPISDETRSFLSKHIGHFIDGEVVVGTHSMPVIDPSTGKQVATASVGTAEDVDRAVRSARAAFDDGRWRNLPPHEKERVLRRMAELVEEKRDVFGELDAVDAGLLRSYVRFLEVFAIDGINYFAGWPSKISGTLPAVPSEFTVLETREPVGVVGMIMPWNGPTAVFVFVAAALAAGNTVVLKPAENTPTTALLMAEVASEAGLPDGCFNVVQGTGEVAGDALVRHPGVNVISFTGSVPTGRRIQAAAADRLTRVSLELGGKSPIIVFPDADIEAAALTAAGSCWGGSGQVCTAGTRALVHRSIHDEFVRVAVESGRSLKLGPAFDETATMGPLVSQAQLDRVSSYVELGRKEGAELALPGGRWGEAGFFHEPVIFTEVRNDMRIAQEEIFGPVLSVIPFDTEEEALAIANDVEYGLAAGVFTENLSRALRFSRELQAGTVWVNSYQMVYPSVPYGGVKQSGYGRTLGEACLEDFTQRKSVWLKV